MKYIIIAVVVLAILGGIALKPKTVDYVAPEVVEKEVVTKVEELQTRIDAALTASSTDIEAEAQAAYADAKEQAELRIKTRVRDEYLKEIEAVNEADKKKLDDY